MLTTTLITGAICLAQIGYSHTVPATNEFPLRVTMQDGESFFAYLPDGWEKRGSVTARLDEPWNGSPTRPIDVADIDRGNTVSERESEWLERHIRNWEALNYRNLGEGDDFYWVPESEIELAQGAREMAGGAIELVDASVAVPGSEMAGTKVAVSDPDPPGFLSLWGQHLIILAVAMGSAGGVYWFWNRGGA